MHKALRGLQDSKLPNLRVPGLKTLMIIRFYKYELSLHDSYCICFISDNTNMNQLFGRMRELSIRDLKQRREEIFERTRRMMEADGEEDVEESCEIQETQN